MDLSLPISTIIPSFSPISSNYPNASSPVLIHTHHFSPSFAALKIKTKSVVFRNRCGARRRVIYEEEEEVEGDYWHNEDISMLETYTQSVKDEVLLVTAVVEEEQLEIIVFKGYSSCLSSKTSPDPSISVLPGVAVIKSIDRIKGPFDPNDIHYIEKALTIEEFKRRLHSSRS